MQLAGDSYPYPPIQAPLLMLVVPIVGVPHTIDPTTARTSYLREVHHTYLQPELIFQVR